jgi:hypothetical protein
MKSWTTSDVILTFIGFYYFLFFLEVVSFYPTTSEKIFVFWIGIAGINKGGKILVAI